MTLWALDSPAGHLNWSQTGTCFLLSHLLLFLSSPPVAPSGPCPSVSWLGLPAWSRVLHCSQVCTGMAPNRPALGWSSPGSSLLVSVTLLAPPAGHRGRGFWMQAAETGKESRELGASWYPSEDILTCQCWLFPLVLSQRLPEFTRKSPWTLV